MNRNRIGVNINKAFPSALHSINRTYKRSSSYRFYFHFSNAYVPNCKQIIESLGHGPTCSSRKFPVFRIYHRVLSNFSSRDPYIVLSIPRSATQKEIKIAYFKLAKIHHPDMNPNDPSAKDRFQKISAAYETLSDESKRNRYDANGHSTDGGSTAYSNQSQQSYEDTFRGAQNDFELIFEAWKMYLEDIQADFSNAYTDVTQKGDWNKAKEFIVENKGLVFGVLVPGI